MDDKPETTDYITRESIMFNSVDDNPPYDYYYLLYIIAEIREKTGVGDKPMLSELADAIVNAMNE
jgi:hypothetical protein